MGDVIIEHKGYARIGLLGNPSDVYYGNTISISIANFWASAKLQPSDHLLIKPHPFHDLVQFHSLNHLVVRGKNRHCSPSTTAATAGEEATGAHTNGLAATNTQAPESKPQFET